MSIHSSLKISGALAGVRNVWSRAERIQALKANGLWQDGDSVMGLPKVRTTFKVKSKKQAPAATEGVMVSDAGADAVEGSTEAPSAES